MRRLLAVLTSSFALAFAAAPVGAQSNTVCITGVIQPAGGPSICLQSHTHRLECTRVLLRSSTIRLDQFNGRLVRLTGQNVGVSCPILDVQQVDPNPPARLEWCGSAVTGCPLKLKVCPVGMGLWYLLGSATSDFRPVGCASLGFVPDGTLLLGQPVLTIASGGPGACGEVLINVPMNNGLVGLNVWFQGARMDIGPVGPLQLTNAQCFRIAPLLPPCAQINC